MRFATLPVVAMLLLAAAARADDADMKRLVVPLRQDWKFLKNAPAGAESAATAAWETVTVPHTWNALDGEDGGENYFRGECVYRRPFVLLPDELGRTVYLCFQGASQRATITINGKEVGKHAGSFSAFCFDVTPFVHPGTNELAVRVTNTEDKTVAPWNADFTFFGGLYRDVELFTVDPVHISPLDDGAAGIAVTTPAVTKDAATINIRSLLRNSTAAAASRIVQTDLLDAAGNVVLTNQQRLSVDPGEPAILAATFALPSPHLWDGRKDPYLYSARVRVLRDGRTLDQLTQRFGVRAFAVDPVKGFLLNGQPYDLHGVNRHQDRIDKGWAISDADHDEDMALIKEMGCTAVRLAHYQHAQHFYDLCDENGIVVWAEVPIVNQLGTTPAFIANWRQQYRDLIKQNGNHPSIFCWSAGNEVDPPATPSRGNDVYAAFRDMSLFGHQLDASRPTASAWRERFHPPADMTDVFGLNAYLGWYGLDYDQLESYIGDHSKGDVKGKWAMTEYGAGSSIYYHTEKPVRMDHSEEYQCLFHEQYLKVLSAHPEIWGKFVWSMFDFAVDSRKEGDHAGRNDKGLVTYDRKTRKDAFFFYKANWSEQPTLHLTAARFSVRGVPQIPVKIYSNAPEVELFLNGHSLGKKSNTLGTFVWENVPLNQGPNALRAAASLNGKPLEDQCTFTYSPGAPTEVDIPQDQTMAAELQKGPPRAPLSR